MQQPLVSNSNTQPHVHFNIEHDDEDEQQCHQPSNASSMHDTHDKYQEIIELNPIEFQLNMHEIADYIIDLEYSISQNNIDPCITLRNINFIISCYIWYYIRDDENWQFIDSLSEHEKESADQYLTASYYDYKCARYFEQQPGFKHTLQRIPKSLCIGSAVGIVSSVGAITVCIAGTVGVISGAIGDSINIMKEAKQCETTETLAKLPAIPLKLGAAAIIGGIVGATTVIAIPCVTLGSAGLYLVNGTDITDPATWQYLGATKLNVNVEELLNRHGHDEQLNGDGNERDNETQNEEDHDAVIVY